MAAMRRHSSPPAGSSWRARACRRTSARAFAGSTSQPSKAISPPSTIARNMGWVGTNHQRPIHQNGIFRTLLSSFYFDPDAPGYTPATSESSISSPYSFFFASPMLCLMSAEHGFRVPKSSLLWYWSNAIVMLEQCYRDARKILPFSKLSDFVQ